jgi:hypothetical protein
MYSQGGIWGVGMFLLGSLAQRLMNINEITAPPGHAKALKRLATDDDAR